MHEFGTCSGGRLSEVWTWTRLDPKFLGPGPDTGGPQKVAGPDLDQTMDSLADVHAGLLPIELALLKATHRATIHLMTLPQTHPLHSIILSTKANPP